MTSIMDQIDITAHHEAAHAVAYIRFGLPFRYVTIRGRYSVGQVALHRPRGIDAFNLAVISAAGPVAERHYAPGHHGPIGDELAELAEFMELEGDGPFGYEPTGDLERLIQIYPDRAMQMRLWSVTEQLVTGSWWPSIEAVAKALLDSPRALTCAEVKAVMERAA